jgi:2-amino-4-hydroxy-6-hydroxymethyldihydropteridine diphosphokinase
LTDERRHRVYLALGSNRDAARNLPRAVRALAAHGTLAAVSVAYETVPVGTDDPAPFLNAALLLITDTPADRFKRDIIAGIERRLGRVRDPHDAFAPRTIDIDIVLWDTFVGDLGGRPVPDPDLERYLHVAWPLAEIAPDLPHPVTGRRLADIARDLARTTPLPVIRPDVILNPGGAESTAARPRNGLK